ncbi:MAG: glycosyltransferase involved in cell wall biosynthesis [Phycisphaerales bacterium]|jgi:glycosyltransferase involved in cell wall biosynthesis
MRILMLGWEFPPFVSGGLGTACQGLTRALNAQGHEVMFVLPKPIGNARSDMVELMGPETLRRAVARVQQIAEDEPDTPVGEVLEGLAPVIDASVPVPMAPPVSRAGPMPMPSAAPGTTTFTSVPAGFSGPYTGLNVGGTDSIREMLAGLGESDAVEALASLRPGGIDGTGGGNGGGGTGEERGGGLGAIRGATAKKLAEVMTKILAEMDEGPTGDGQYGQDLFGDAQRYAKLVCALALQNNFDVIHANDWLTYPAGLAVKALTGKPLVCHVHATEFDRSGENVNQQVYDIERAGMHGADRVIAVSRLTKSICVTRYGADENKVDVVYNGVEQDDLQSALTTDRIEREDKIVLFLGRITMQKGPEYFIQAAKRVLEKIENVKFVVAGSGDMAVRMIEDAAANGIGHKVLFTGFLRGRDVDRVFRMADCFVMPSVSEPFGIAPLEAMRNDTPVIVSKQSGVSEVLTHALKVDFWDTDEMANKIVAVLKYPPLSETLREHGAFELRGLTWDGAATKAVKVYGRAIASE